MYFLIKHHAMKKYWWRGGIDPHIYKFDSLWKRAVSNALMSLFHCENISQYPLRRKLSGPQIRSGRIGKENKSRHFPHRELKPGCPARRLVSILTGLTWIDTLTHSRCRK